MKIKDLCIEIRVGINEDELPEHYGYYSSIDETIEALKELKKEIPTWEENNEV